MPWTVALTEVVTEGQNVRACVSFTHTKTGEKIVRITQADTLSIDDVRRFAGQVIESLQSRDECHAKLSKRIGEIDAMSAEELAAERDARVP